MIVVGTSYSCKAQVLFDNSEMPVEQVASYFENENGLPDHITYVKDINNVLNKYVGTWNGSYGNKSYEFRIVKYTTPLVDGFKEDILLMRYKIVNGANVIENTLNIQNEQALIIRGNFLDGNTYNLIYSGRESLCGQHGDIYISISSLGSNKMNFTFFPGRDLIEGSECPTIPDHIMPLDPITLTKQ